MGKNDKKQPETAIVPEPSAGALATYGKYANLGFEGTSKDDLKVPFIKQLQGLSPEIADGMEGAKLGMFYNTATGELIPMEKGFNFVPISKTHHYVEWRPREAGGGFVASHDINSDVVNKAIALNGGNKFGKLTTPAAEGGGKNDLIESHDVLLLFLNEEGTLPTGDSAIFSFTKTKIKPMVNWWTKMYTLKLPLLDGKARPRPPLFAFRTRLSGFKDPRTAKGIFFNVKCDPFVEGSWMQSLVPEEHAIILETALGFYESFAKGDIKPDYEKAANTASEETSGEEVPF